MDIGGFVLHSQGHPAWGVEGEPLGIQLWDERAQRGVSPAHMPWGAGCWWCEAGMGVGRAEPEPGVELSSMPLGTPVSCLGGVPARRHHQYLCPVTHLGPPGAAGEEEQEGWAEQHRDG